jgi:anti-sigma factor RsiW
MMKCAGVKKMLCRYVDNELGRADSEEVKAHLEACAACREEAAGLLRVKRVISAKERKSLPQDYLVCRLRREIAAQEEPLGERVSVLAGIGGFARRVIPVPVAAIALSLVFLLLTSRQQAGEYSLDEHLFSGSKTTTETALALMLGVYN